MSRYVLTPLAKADIFDIWTYIAEHNQDAAEKYPAHSETALARACKATAFRRKADVS
jgi:plasmid stabilization system protein ParE